LEELHAGLLDRVPSIDRIACIKYDRSDDLLKTFINSTRTGESIAHYDYKLSDSESLSHIASSGLFRVIDNIPTEVRSGNTHSQWLRQQGYCSSMTIPLYDNGEFFGLAFFDSTSPSAFTPVVQRDVLLFCNLINMAISSEMSAIRAIIASTHIARDFANLRDFETGGHLERMARYSRVIANALAPSHGLDDEFVEHVFLFAPLHDIGKIGIPDSILLKPGKLDPNERIIMESHVEKGVEMVERIVGDFGLGQLPDSSILRNIVGGHHEWMDGTGYPRKLKGTSIPLEARIVTTADIFDALTSKRPYKEAWSVGSACDELRKMAENGKLDPICVEAMIDYSSEVEQIKERYQDADLN
jgi:HD-GYP domain-containing protein (c-di-GMP phosphodiesterase class II)